MVGYNECKEEVKGGIECRKRKVNLQNVIIAIV